MRITRRFALPQILSHGSIYSTASVTQCRHGPLDIKVARCAIVLMCRDSYVSRLHNGAIQTVYDHNLKPLSRASGNLYHGTKKPDQNLAALDPTARAGAHRTFGHMTLMHGYPAAWVDIYGPLFAIDNLLKSG